MTGTFVGLTILNLLGFSGSSTALTGFPLVGTLFLVFVMTMLARGRWGFSSSGFACGPCVAFRAPHQ